MRPAGRRYPRRAGAIVAWLVLVPWLVLVALPAIALAADPSATPGGAAGDPRSSGQGPGLVGNPGWAIAVVVVIGVTALVATLAYVRLTSNRGRPPDR